MRNVIVENTRFSVRSLRRKEMKSLGLECYGFKTYFFEPVRNDHGVIDLEKAEEAQKIVMDAVIDGGIDAVDAAGGNGAIQKVWKAILAETYGLPGEEKNLSTSGPSDQTKTE